MTGQNDLLENMREDILRATLPHVPFDGWTMTACEAGATDAGYNSGDGARAFPGGPLEMIELLSRLADKKMVAEMEKRGVSNLRIRERVGAGIRIRLENSAAHKEAVRRAVALVSFPQNSAIATRCLYRTVDAIWYAAGDTSTDYNFYTKRGLLAGVYFATLLYWLDDDSPGSENSWAFLDRRIANALAIPKVIGSLREKLGEMPNPFRMFGGDRQRRAGGF